MRCDCFFFSGERGDDGGDGAPASMALVGVDPASEMKQDAGTRVGIARMGRLRPGVIVAEVALTLC